MSGPTVFLTSFAAGRYPATYRFDGLTEEVAAHSPDEVLPALRRIEAAVAGGLHAAGFVSYEAAAGINPDLPTRPAGPFPLLWFGLFRTRFSLAPRFAPDDDPPRYATTDWRSFLSPADYAAAVGKARHYIAAGDCYQVNFTFRERFRFTGEPQAYFNDLCKSQKAPFCALIDTGRFRVLSASPELFFELRRGTLTCRPMKGTARRGRWRNEDEQLKAKLRESDKERAENLMIVDLMRNDLGMVARTGSVRVEELFAVETLDTVHQMTSTISARLRDDAGLEEVFRALFPCGSVTGAPKRRSMEIIRELETAPRGLYTGCIGYVSPSDTAAGPSRATACEAVFSVAIRTAVIDGESGAGELGLGSGITIGSDPGTEFAECLAKGRFARQRLPDFQLIETLLHEEGQGFFLLERHLARLFRSAAYYGFNARLGTIKEVLELRTRHLTGRQKVRLQVNRRGGFTIQTEPLAAQPDEPAKLRFAGHRIDPADPFLYHKTSHRPLYRREREAHPDCADVVFLNDRDEVTEGTIGNIVARIGGELVTPPVDCGLLPGTFREELLATGTIRERVITGDELAAATELFLINSVRRWQPARLSGAPPTY